MAEKIIRKLKVQLHKETAKEILWLVHWIQNKLIPVQLHHVKRSRRLLRPLELPSVSAPLRGGGASASGGGDSGCQFQSSCGEKRASVMWPASLSDHVHTEKCPSTPATDGSLDYPELSKMRLKITAVTSFLWNPAPPRRHHGIRISSSDKCWHFHCSSGQKLYCSWCSTSPLRFIPGDRF